MREKRDNIIKRKKLSRRKIFEILTKIILCLAVISFSSIAAFNMAVKSSSEVVMSKAENIKGNISEKIVGSEKIQEVKKEPEAKKDPFEGMPVINDNRGVPVICYHSISREASDKNSITVSKEKFRQHLQVIKDNGYTTLTIAQLNDYLFKEKPIPEKSVVITFDDGYKDNYTEAFPILKEFNMNASIFVIASYLNRDLYLSTKEIREMSDYGIDIESHTVSHVKLSTLPYEKQLEELRESKDILEKITDKPIIAIAYPEGKYNDETKKAVKETGYSMGFTIERGYADRKDNLAQLNRVCVDYTYRPNSILRVLKSLNK